MADATQPSGLVVGQSFITRHTPSLQPRLPDAISFVLIKLRKDARQGAPIHQAAFELVASALTCLYGLESVEHTHSFVSSSTCHHLGIHGAGFSAR
jgi:hypothetical protein